MTSSIEDNVNSDCSFLTSRKEVLADRPDRAVNNDGDFFQALPGNANLMNVNRKRSQDFLRL